MMISFMFYNVKQLFQTLKQEFNNNKKVALPWDISKMKNDSKRQGFECLSWDNILFYIHTYCLQYERVHFEYLLEIKIFIFFCPMVTDFTNLTRFTQGGGGERTLLNMDFTLNRGLYIVFSFKNIV